MKKSELKKLIKEILTVLNEARDSDWDYDVKKIWDRQMDAIDSFDFLKKQELIKFCELANENSKLVDGYFKLSTGWSSESDHKRVSKKLADFIKKSIKGKLKEDDPYGKADPSKYLSPEGVMDPRMVQIRNKIGKEIQFSDPKTNEILKGRILGTMSKGKDDFVILKYKGKKIYVPIEWITFIKEMSSVGAMGGGDAFQTPFAFSRRGADPKKKRALKNNKWEFVGK